MKRHLEGLRETAAAATDLQDGVFLVRVERARHRWDVQKPYFIISFVVVRPDHWAGHTFSGRLYATRKALWKLSWFLRDFGYDEELLRQDEVDEQALRGLTGVVKIADVVINGRTYLNLEAFAPAAQWGQFAAGGSSDPADLGADV